jgi:hypothetical protein
MNRIYQGKVSKAELLDAKGEPLTSPPQDWDGLSALWEHHALFQDAVNYYLVCLLALAAKGNDVYDIREKLNAKNAENEDDELMIWRPFTRRGAKRRGLRDSVVPYLCPGKTDATPEDCFAAVLAGNECGQSEVGKARLSAGLQQLLDKCTGAAGCKQAAPVFLPRFAKPTYQGSYGEDTSTLARESAGARLPFVLHDPKTRPNSHALDEFDVYSIALRNEKKPKFIGAEVIKKLREMVAEWRKKNPDAEQDWKRLETVITKLPEDFEIPGYAATSAKNEVKFRLFAMFFFRHLEQSDFTLGLLRATTKRPEPNEKPPEKQSVAAGTGDPIRLARGQRGYVFRAFTALPCWGANETATPQWIAFDFAAFEEALKALHQVDAKAEEREKERERKQAQHDFQRGKTKKWKGGASGEDEQAPEILAGDPRIVELERLVDVDLREEYEMSEGVEVKYGLHPRTVRGFRDVRKKWNDALGEGAQYSETARGKLWDLLTEYKKENAQTMGSPAIFDAMVKEENWLIWREPTGEQLREWRKAARLPEDAEFAKDPLQALTDERELLAEIERLRGPIRLTPADPEHSRRQFYFSDVSALDKKNRLRHDQQTVDTEVAVSIEGKWEVKWVRIHFTAPRLLRDQLNNTSGADSAWQQAMMTALGLKPGRLTKTEKGKVREAKFAECAAVALMPEIGSNGEKRILLNFPLTLDGDAIAKQLGKAARWDGLQFGGADKESYWLRWPATWIDEKKERKKAPPAPWWKSSEPFSCLSVDLGQRDAGAFALLEATVGQAPKEQSRKLGIADGKTWWATVRATGMLRLPGEDALVLRDGQWQEEFSGERGRLASDGEWNEAQDICRKLGLNPDDILSNERHRHSFPELNDQLLFALRKAQSRLARLQSWSCIESNAKRKEAIAKQLKAAVAELAEVKEGSQPDPLLAELRPLIEMEVWKPVSARLIQEVTKQRAAIQRELVRIADRIQPLRGRQWEWVLRDDGKNHMVRQTKHGSDDRKKLLAGQRGLSMERIEQLESLRQRCQSLNRALRQEPGQPANLGRSKRGIELPDPCPELLERLDALKEQRVNQTAHLILAQALGVRLRAHGEDDAARLARDIHGEYERIPGRKPVDFLVLENLDRYLASQGRSRGENSKLMKWSHRAILGKLKQLCEPYGLRVLETPAAYSSRFCSLTGVAGFRAVELTPESAKEFRWKKHLDRLADPVREKKLSKDERAESQRVQSLFAELERMNADIRKADPARPKWRTLLAPAAGGPIFIPASEMEWFDRKNRKTGKTERMFGYKPVGSCRPVVAQADINAAINLGLRAIAAPETADIHLRIRAKREGETFVVRADNKREKARWGDKPVKVEVLKESERKKLLADAHLNFFADLGGVAEYDHTEIAGGKSFASGRGIWGSIKGNDWHVGKDWQRVEEINRARIQKLKHDSEDNLA